MLSIVTIANTLVWIPLSFYTAANWPQVFKNWQLKTTEGTDKNALFILHVNGYTAFMFNYFLWLPWQYRLVSPIILSSLIIMVIQTYIYAKTKKERDETLLIYGTQTVLLFLFGAIGLWWDRILFGNIAGWICFCGGIACRFPQIYMNWKQQSMYAYSLIKVIMVTGAACISLFVSLVLNLPIQGVLSALSAILYRSVQLVQFFLYRDNNLPRHLRKRGR